MQPGRRRSDDDEGQGNDDDGSADTTAMTTVMMRMMAKTMMEATSTWQEGGPARHEARWEAAPKAKILALDIELHSLELVQDLRGSKPETKAYTPRTRHGRDPIRD